MSLTGTIRRGPSGSSGAAPPEAPPLVVMPLRTAEEHVLVVVGEADLSTADLLRDRLLRAVAARPPALRVELDGLEFCDLRGLDALQDGVGAAAAAGVCFALHGMCGQLAWLHRTFPPSGRSRRTGS